MRISDWSSDVCSSDLSVGGNAGMNARELTQISAAQTHLRDPDHAPSGLETCHVATSYSSPHDPRFDAAGRARPGGEPGREIGSASCRERGVSVRVDLGGRCIIKKKNTDTIRQA